MTAPWPGARELADLLKFADLRVDVVLSAQLAAGYKPDAKVYVTAVDLLGCPPDQTGAVAARAVGHQRSGQDRSGWPQCVRGPGADGRLVQ